MSTSSTFLGQVLTRKFFTFAGNSLLLYDYLLTLSLEVSYIWSAPWTFVKALFLFNRYGNLIGNTFIMLEETGYLSRGSIKFCKAFQLYLPFFAVLSGESIRLLVVLRACAIMRCKRSTIILSAGLYVLYSIVIIAVSTYLSEMALGHMQFEYLDKVGICVAPFPPNIWTTWLMPLILDAFILGIVCYNLLSMTLWSTLRPSPLIRHLARDAVVFYVTALFNVLFEIMCWNYYRLDPRNFIATGVTFPLLSVVGQRLVLNLRRLRAHPETTSDVSREIHRQIGGMQVHAEQSVELQLEDGFEMIPFSSQAPTKGNSVECERNGDHSERYHY